MQVKKSILVTGGAGFIGAHTVHQLLKNNHIVAVVDSFIETKSNVIEHENVTYYEVDIRDKTKLLEVFKKVKPVIVFHFAALTSVPESVKDPSSYYDTNMFGSINVLESMKEHGVTKIVFSSSASVYGETTCEEIFEDHPKNPTNPYGRTKLIFENILRDYHRAYGFSSVSLRYFCAAGCDVHSGLGEHHLKETHVIPSIVETLHGKREEFFVFGTDFDTHDGTGVRDYIHVSDLASAHIAAMNKMFEVETICEQYNLGINKGFSVLELIKAAEEVSGKKLNYSTRERRAGDPSKLIANSDKAQKELNWKPIFTDIKHMVESAHDFFHKKIHGKDIHSK